MAQIPRLYVEASLGEGQRVNLTRDQAHYLFSVMRLGVGSRLDVFNGSDGAWAVSVAETGKRGGALIVERQVQPQRDPPDLWLMFAPIKKTRTDFIVEKAAEMGAARILPVQTDYTNAERVRQDRLQAHAVEAAEQCGGTFVPSVDGLQPLSKILDAWPKDRRIMFCDEGLAGEARVLPEATGACAILIGPEGGFSEAERKRLADMDAAFPASLGPRILRADTAAVAAMTLWQLSFGDW